MEAIRQQWRDRLSDDDDDDMAVQLKYNCPCFVWRHSFPVVQEDVCGDLKFCLVSQQRCLSTQVKS